MTHMMLKKNKKIVSDWIDRVFNQKDLTAVDELKFHTYLDWTPFPSQDVNLPVSGLKKSLPEFFSAFPNFRFRAESLIAEGDMVVCLGAWSGTHEGEFMNYPPTGKHITGTRIDIFRISGDKMSEHWGCGSELGMLQVLGRVPHANSSQPRGAESIAREFVEEVYNHRNFSAIEALLDDHAFDHSHQTISAFMLLTAFPDLEVHILDICQTGDRVTILSNVTGTHSGQFMGISSTGKSVTVPRTDIFRIRNEKIVEAWQELDTDKIVAQLSA